MEKMREWIELASAGIEALAVAIMLVFILAGTFHWLARSRQGILGGYDRYRVILGKSLLVGLELLVAADIIRTVALDLTLRNIGILGALVLVRTFLGWTLEVEVEGRWPWQPAKGGESPDGEP
jgi:uncharacterized membrane protein